MSLELKPEGSRGFFPECPYCDQTIDPGQLALNQEMVCPSCGSKLKLVKLDGVLIFLKDGWL